MYPAPKISKDKQLQVEFIGYAEPNNGRELWEVEVKYQGKKINDKLFKRGWNYLNFEVQKWTLNDEEDKYYYLPIEGVGKLIVKKKMDIYDVSKQGLSTASFRGNYFQYGYLIEVFFDAIILTNLSTFETQKIAWTKDEYIQWGTLISKEELKIDYSKVIEGKRVQLSRTIAIKL